MAEILIKAQSNTHPDTEKDRRGAYKIGMPVVVMEDGHEWGKEERLPKFIVIKIPGISKDKVKQYIEPEYSGTDSEGNPIVYRRRLWHISWSDLPKNAKTKILDTGELIIKAGAYSGQYDYTWTQVKTYFKRITTGLSETLDL